MAVFLAVFIAASTVGAAFAAQGDIIGLADYATWGDPRPNVYEADLNGSGESYVLQIVQVEEVSADLFIPVGFPTAVEAESVAWTQNTPNMANGYIDEDPNTYYAVYSADLGGYYLHAEAYNLVGSLGPDSWKATDSDGNTGDFSFVGTVYNNADTGRVANIRIEFYDQNPTLYPAFATGVFDTVYGYDDYDSITIVPDHGRSYPTPLDAVAHGTLPPGNIITTYHKYTQTQDILDIVDVNGAYHTPGAGEGFLYAVYYPDPNVAGQYDRDPDSEYIGYDDYLLQQGALVIYAIGNYDDVKEYASYFPDTITRK
jgi:hypothetical protein